MKKRIWNKMMAMALVGAMLVTPMSVYAHDADTDVTADIEEPISETVADLEEITSDEVVEFEESTADVADLDEVDVAEDLDDPTPNVEPRSVTSYYPSSGATSGNFFGATSDVAVFDNLPGSTVLNISYAIEGGACNIRFYLGTNTIGLYTTQTGSLSGNGVTTIVLPASGTYSVKVYYPSGSSNTTVIYSYRIYK
jgi:hypothetical protein